MRRAFSEYAIVGILLGLCAVLSVLTLQTQQYTGETGGEKLGQEVLAKVKPGAAVVVITGEGQENVAFAAELERVLTKGSMKIVGRAQGSPRVARLALEKWSQEGVQVDVIAATAAAGRWAVLEDLQKKYPGLGSAYVLPAPTYVWPSFLKVANLRNIANQIAIIAILAVGMTMVIITGGIDLSVGSMIALSAVVAALLYQEMKQKFQAMAGTGEMQEASLLLICAALAIAGCTLLGLANGLVITLWRVPPFIATLGMMLVAHGLARLLSQDQSIGGLPTSAVWLGRGADLLHIPNAVVLMLLLYGVAHIVMTRTVLGRHIYAVGGNTEAARLSGVPIRRVLLLVYALCGALAGLGGIVTASLFQSAASTYGNQYELYVVAAVVVGGTSITGGEGKIIGTLIGAFIIAVIKNGMNLLGIHDALQEVVLGMVIVAAVALDWLGRQ